MDVPNPSSAWTPEERLEVLAFLANGLSKHSREVQLVRPVVVDAVTERMSVVATYPARFLEDNREQTLESVEETIRRLV